MKNTMLVAIEFDDSAEQTPEAMQVRLDNFRESVQPSTNYGLTIFVPQQPDAIGMAQSLDWTPRNGEMVYVCQDCGCLDCEVDLWRHANTLADSGSDGPVDQRYCPACESETSLCCVKFPTGECEDCGEGTVHIPRTLEAIEAEREAEEGGDDDED